MAKLTRIACASLAAAMSLAAVALPVFAQSDAPAPRPAPPPPGLAPANPSGVEVAPPAVTGPAPPARAPAALPSTIAPAPSAERLPPKHVAWSFDGPFGTYDRPALQRGFQVYKEVCSACHSLTRIAFRNLGEPGGPTFSQAEVAAIAAGYKVPADPDERGRTTDDSGQPLTRSATPADYIPPPFPNEKAARAAMNGSLPPDLSLITKSRAGHEDYIYSILTGFGRPPANEKTPPGLYYNPYFPRHQIAMPPPLTNGSVTYADGTPNTLDQEARDVVTFLAWAAEPKMEERKRTGFNVMMFLFAFTALLYFSYRRVWHGHHDVGATGTGKDS